MKQKSTKAIWRRKACETRKYGKEQVWKCLVCAIVGNNFQKLPPSTAFLRAASQHAMLSFKLGEFNKEGKTEFICWKRTIYMKEGTKNDRLSGFLIFLIFLKLWVLFDCSQQPTWKKVHTQKKWLFGALLRLRYGFSKLKLLHNKLIFHACSWS